PESFCAELPKATPELRDWVAQLDPNLGDGALHVLPEDTALELFQRASDAGWGSVQFLTGDAFREPCTVYLSQDVLRSVDDRFELDLVTRVQGQDQHGRDFAMIAMLAGNGRLLAVYDRDAIVYRNEKEERDFQLASRIALATPAHGRLENIDGLCAEVTLLGCIDIDSLVKKGDVIHVTAG